ncbi:MAG: hypothetical protein LH467_11165 [Gemmatimonadaceae bacterium]|nr:hypothetical protein [Gemmatimonadaceae bacterium]
MSPIQFALACGAPGKWIHNARYLLGRAPTDGPREVRWLGLVHELHSSLGCALAVAARVADAVLAAPTAQRELVVPLGEPSGATVLVIDLWRDHSVYLARLSRALVRPPLERRGRPRATAPTRRSARARAVAYGVDVERLRTGIARSPAERLSRLDADVAFLAAARIERRGRVGRAKQ